MNRLKSRISNLFLILCVLCVLCGAICFSGCDESSSAQRIEAVRAIVNQAVSVSNTIDASVADIRTVIASCEAALIDPNIPADLKPQVQLALATAKSKLETLAARKKQVSDILASYQATLAAVDSNAAGIGQEIALYGSGAVAIAPLLPEKARGYVYLAGLLLPLAGGLIASVIKNLKQKDKITADKAVLADTVASVYRLIHSDQVKDREEAKFILQDNQSGATQDAIDPILQELKKLDPVS